MISPDRPKSGFGALLAAEVTIVGLAVRREALIAGIGLAGTCVLVTIMAIRDPERVNMVPEVLLPALVVAIILPWLVWKGDPPFGNAYLWTLPVRRQKAAVAKIAAGAFWLILAMLAGFAMLAAMALATGGTIGSAETLVVGPLSGGLEGATEVPWSTPLWMWAVPFGAALTVYAASSALLIGLRHPVRWVGAVAVAVALLVILAVTLGHDSALNHAIGRFLEALVVGRWGLDFLMTGGLTSLPRSIDVPGPGWRELWVALPTAGRWAAALLVWFGGALIALALALRRHWER